MCLFWYDRYALCGHVVIKSSSFMDTKLIVVGLLALLIGGVAGYGIGDHKERKGYTGDEKQGEHRMADGSMMRDDEGMSMAEMMADMNDNLRDKQGDAFDQAFLKEMIVHHEGAVGMAELARTQASHQEIKDLAEAIIAAQNKEIADMQTWLQQWYGDGSDEAVGVE